MLSITYIALFVACTTLPVWNYHYERYKTFNFAQMSMSLFCSINFMICLWELALYYHRKLVRSSFLIHQKTLPPLTLPKPLFLFEDVKFRHALTLQHWSKVWSTYSIMDSSYSDTGSFGFWIDTGNGHSTLIPTILFSLGMTWDILSPKTLGIIGIALNWQMFYGTILYFLSYYHRVEASRRVALWLVIFSNGLWMLAPGYAMYLSYQFIQQDSLQLVRA